MPITTPAAGQPPYSSLHAIGCQGADLDEMTFVNQVLDAFPRQQFSRSRCLSAFFFLPPSEIFAESCSATDPSVGGIDLRSYLNSRFVIRSRKAGQR